MADLSATAAQIFGGNAGAPSSCEWTPLRRGEGQRLRPLVEKYARTEIGTALWSDPNAVLLLDALAELRPGCRYLLVYSDPADELALRSLDVDLISTLDVDDVMLPHKLELEVLALNDSDAHVAFSDVAVVQPDDSFVQDTRAYGVRRALPCSR